MKIEYLIPAIIMIVTTFVALTVLQNADAKKLFRAWAEQNGYQLTDMTRCGLNTGPFQRMSRSSAPVFKIKMKNDRGRERIAWAVCEKSARPWAKLDPNPDVVLVVWDEEYKDGYSRRI